MVTGKHSGRAVSVPIGMLTACGVSIALTMCLSVIGAMLVSRELLGQERIGILAMMILTVASVMGGITAAGKIKMRRMQMSLLHGALYGLFLVVLTFLFFGGQFQGMGTTLVVIAVSSIGGGLIANRSEGKGSGKKRKKYHR